MRGTRHSATWRRSSMQVILERSATVYPLFFIVKLNAAMVVAGPRLRCDGFFGALEICAVRPWLKATPLLGNTPPGRARLLWLGTGHCQHGAASQKNWCRALETCTRRR